ncbi:hypothetical protein FHG87_007976 [Trinorchestia longiramus]|nr:hypothetical protein FHG87_007976 [Trinorchestia longiramus]
MTAATKDAQTLLDFQQSKSCKKLPLHFHVSGDCALMPITFSAGVFFHLCVLHEWQVWSEAYSSASAELRFKQLPRVFDPAVLAACVPALYVASVPALYAASVPALYAASVPALYAASVPALYAASVPALYAASVPALYAVSVPAAAKNRG